MTELFEYFLQTFFIDIDECDSDQYFGCPDRQTCVNFEGSYECTCLEEGYTTNGKDCVGK